MLTESIALDLPQVAQSLDYSCGAACFDSMYRYLKGASPGEMHFAKALGTLEFGFTPVERVAELACELGFQTRIKNQAGFHELKDSLLNKEVVFVTWWFEDAGHYSLVKNIDDYQITLMDPWQARDGCDAVLSIPDFQIFWKARGSVMISVK